MDLDSFRGAGHGGWGSAVIILLKNNPRESLVAEWAPCTTPPEAEFQWAAEGLSLPVPLNCVPVQLLNSCGIPVQRWMMHFQYWII